MKPGLARAVGAGILGFLGSVLLVTVLRDLQGIEPAYDAQIAMILAAFVAGFAFVWGAGGTDPRMSQHPHEPIIDEETGLIISMPDEKETQHRQAELFDKNAHPGAVLSFSMWRVAFYVVTLIVMIFFLSSLPIMPFLRVSGDPMASTDSIGTYSATVPLFGDVEMTQLTAFVLFVMVTLVSLGLFASLFALSFTALSRNLKEVKENKPTRFDFQTERDLERKPFVRDFLIAAGVIGVYILLYDYMVRGAMRWSMDVNVVLVLVAIAVGLFLTGRRTNALGETGEAAFIEAIKVHSMVATLIFLFPVLYILHYEALVGLIFPTAWLRTLLSLGAALTLSPVLTFVFYTDTVSDMFIRSARNMRAGLLGKDIHTTATDITPVDDSTTEGSEA